MKSFYLVGVASLFIALGVGAHVDNKDSTADAFEPYQNPVYNIDCARFPEVCNNLCFYQNCKQGSLTMTIDRNIDLREQSGCGGKVNRCSSISPGFGGVNTGWPKNPKSGLVCNEQPNSNIVEGGARAATRCVPGEQHRGERLQWARFIDSNKLEDGTEVDINLGRHRCSSSCTPGSKTNPSDPIRQL